MTRALIVCAVTSSVTVDLVRREAPEHSVLIGADRGALTMLEAGVQPSLMVGDADSLDSDGLETVREAGVLVELHPVKKDVTDLDLALDAARRAGADEVTVIGATGGRIDHTLATVGSLTRTAELRPRVVDPWGEAWVLTRPHRTEVELPCPGATVSVLALSPIAKVESRGLAWPLEGLELGLLSSRGVSNLVVDAASLRVVEGIVLVTVCRDDSAIHT